VQEQLNIELRTSCIEQQQRLQETLSENCRMTEENRWTAIRLEQANSALVSVRQQYDEDMLEVQGLSKILQRKILELQDDLALANEQIQLKQPNSR
jgi:hypothetical protein